MATSAWPRNGDAVSGESAASVRRRPQASANAKGAPNKDGNTRSGSNDAPTNEPVEDMLREMDRFVERGPPSGPAHGLQLPYPSPSTSQGTAHHPAPNTSTTEKDRIPSQTATADTASSRKKK